MKDLLEHSLDLFVTTNIEIEPETTLDSLTRSLISDSVYVDEFNSIVGEDNSDFQFVSANKTKISRGLVDANQILIEGKNTDRPYKELDIVAINDGVGNQLRFKADPEEFNRYMPIIKKMIDSFEFIGFS